jgi:hypothetical protein
MRYDRELDVLVALLEEHGILPAYESNEEFRGHLHIYEKVRQTPSFPMSVGEVRDLLNARAVADGR